MTFWQGHDLADFNDLHTADFVDHSNDARGVSRDAFRQSVEALYQSFPDFNAQTTVLVVDEAEQTVSIKWVAQGTHSAEFMGVPATGKTIDFEGIEIIACCNDKVVARWGEWDGLQILKQLDNKGG